MAYDRNKFHVRQNQSGQWEVYEEGMSRPTSVHGTKSGAQDEAHNLSERRRPSSYVTYREDNTEESRNIYD